MKVRLLTSIASPTWSYSPGEVADIDPEEAARWIKAGIAEAVDGPRAAEAAVIEPSEKAVLPRPKPRKAR